MLPTAQFFPPLQAVPAPRLADAIEDAIFLAGANEVIEPLARAAVARNLEALGPRLDILAVCPERLFEHLGLANVADEARLNQAVAAAREMAATPAPHRKLRSEYSCHPVAWWPAYPQPHPVPPL